MAPLSMTLIDCEGNFSC